MTPVECCHSAACTCARHTAVLLQEKLLQVHTLYLIHLHEYVRVCGYGTSDASEPQRLSSGPISYQHLVPQRGNTKTSSFVCMCTALYTYIHSQHTLLSASRPAHSFQNDAVQEYIEVNIYQRKTTRRRKTGESVDSLKYS